MVEGISKCSACPPSKTKTESSTKSEIPCNPTPTAQLDSHLSTVVTIFFTCVEDQGRVLNIFF